MTHRLASLLVALLALLGATLWSADTAHAQADPLASVREQIMYANYPEAIAGANAMLARTDLDARTRNAALELLATAQIASRATDEARATLSTLYARDPGHRLSDADASPPVISAFARAREAQPTPVIVRIAHRAPALSRRESPSIEVGLSSNADAVDEVRLLYRQGSDASWSRVVMNRRPDGSYAARIPVVGASDQAVSVTYYVVATAPSGTTLGQAGTEAEPLSLRIPADRSTSLTLETPRTDPLGPAAPVSEGGGSVAEEWWFWTIIGVVVAGGVVTGVVLGTQGDGIPDSTLGTVTLMR